MCPCSSPQITMQIATRFGFHRTTVARHLKQAGETLRTEPADPAFQERVREVYAELGTVSPLSGWVSVRMQCERWCGVSELRLRVSLYNQHKRPSQHSSSPFSPHILVPAVYRS